MSANKDISGYKMCPLDVRLIFSIRKFQFSSSASAKSRAVGNGSELMDFSWRCNIEEGNAIDNE